MDGKEPKILRLNEKTWMFQEETVRFFLLAGQEKALLIDSGCETHHARELAEQLTGLPVMLANTHTDGDHTGSNGEFDEVYMAPAEYMYYRKVQKNTGVTVRPLWDGEILELGGRQVQVIAIPGHTPGSTAFLDIKYRALFSGDPVQDGTIYMFGEQRDIAAYEDSLRRLEHMADRFDVIFPCHASSRVRPSILPLLVKGVEKMRKGEIPPIEAVYLDTPVKEYHIGPAIILYDREVCFPEKGK